MRAPRASTSARAQRRTALARGALPAAGRRDRALPGRDGAAGGHRVRVCRGCLAPWPELERCWPRARDPEGVQAGRYRARAGVLAPNPRGHASSAEGPQGGKRRALPRPPPPRPRCSRPYRDPQSARSPEMAEVQRGGAAGDPWRGAGGRRGRSRPLGRRTVGNGSKLPSSNFIEEAPETDKPALLIPGCFRTPANDGLLGASVSFWFWNSSARFSAAFVAHSLLK